MDADLQDLMDGGLADAITVWNDVVVVTVNPIGPVTKQLIGVQSDTKVEQQVMLSGMGFESKRTFALLINDATVFTWLKYAMTAVDAQGNVARYIHFTQDAHGILLYFELNK